jgi:hypothetical protein
VNKKALFPFRNKGLTIEDILNTKAVTKSNIWEHKVGGALKLFLKQLLDINPMKRISAKEAKITPFLLFHDVKNIALRGFINSQGIFRSGSEEKTLEITNDKPGDAGDHIKENLSDIIKKAPKQNIAKQSVEKSVSLFNTFKGKLMETKK